MNFREAGVVILAAGRSERMKEVKAFLPFSDNVSFIEQIISTYSNWGCAEIVLVTSPESMKRLKQTGRIPATVTIVVNDYPEFERFYSVKLGLGAIEKSSFCFIQNIDNPFIDSQILNLLYEHRSNEKYVSPVFKNKGGHPVLLNKGNINQIIKWNVNSATFKDVLHTMECQKIEMPDDRILININSPEEYHRLFDNPAEMLPSAEPENIIPNPVTENMEVHHHPNVEKKNLKGYLLEGLMIFLAVTMGFIAENIRENITEHKNAKILAQSLLEDIKKDTASLHKLIAYSYKKLNASDSVLAIAHTPRNSWNATSFYTYIVPSVTSIPFKSTDGTYSQLKTSGTLRLFNQSLVNVINSYDVQLMKTEYRDEVEDKGIWILGDLIFDIINLEVISDMRFNKPITHEMYINIADKATKDKFINLITLNKGFHYRAFQEYMEQLKIADKLIEALKKEYHLE